MSKHRAEPDTEADAPDLSDVIEPTEQAVPDHHEHAKTPHPLDDDELAARTEHEREITHARRPETQQ